MKLIPFLPNDKIAIGNVDELGQKNNKNNLSNSSSDDRSNGKKNNKFANVVSRAALLKSNQSKDNKSKNEKKDYKGKKEKKEKANIEEDLFELVGCYKHNQKKQLDYDEVNEEIDNANEESINKTIEERLYYMHEKRLDLDTNMIDWRSGGFYFNRYIYGCYIMFFFSCLNFITGIIYYEYDYKLLYTENTSSIVPTYNSTLQELNTLINNERNSILNNKDAYVLVSDTALFLVLLLTIMTVIAFAFMRKEYIDWKQKIQLMSKDVTFARSDDFKYFVLQILLLFIQPYYFLNVYTFSMRFGHLITNAKVNYIFFTFAIFLRFWYMIRFLIVKSYFYSSRAQRIAAMYNYEASLMFAVKCILKTHPMRTIIVLFSSNIFLGGYLIRIWERFATQEPDRDFDSYLNCIWYSFITMSTVGYGDYTARSAIGRMFACIIAIIGVFVNSTLTVILKQNLTCKGGDLKAYSMMKNISLNEKLLLLRKKLFTKCFRITLTRKKMKKNAKLKQNANLASHLTKLERRLVHQRDELLKIIKSIKQEIISTFKTDHIEIINDKLGDVRKRCVEIKNTIHQFEDVLDSGKENQRNLEALKNQIMSIDENEDD